MTAVLDQVVGARYALYRGDSTLVLPAFPSDSAALEVFSPPFPSMYAYTNTPHDLGNTKTLDEMIDQFAFMAVELLRVLMPGRMCCLHLMQLPAYGTRDGFRGIIDFRGRVISLMTECGFDYAGEATIEKNSQAQATRHKESSLLFKTLATDASKLRMALADYLLYFRKPGANPVPIQAGIHPEYHPDGGWVTQEDWIEWASPVWRRHDPEEAPHGVREMDVLNVRAGRGEDDERHLAPLQLEVIRRCVRLWSNPGEVVLSPFAGIGSEGYVALKQGRRFVGVELKDSYFAQARRNLDRAESEFSETGPDGQLSIEAA